MVFGTDAVAPSRRAADHDLKAISSRIIGVACALVLLHLTLVFVGWAMRDSWIIHFPISPRYGTPTPLTTLGQLLGLIALWLLRQEDKVTRPARAAALALAALTILIGALVLWEYIPGDDLGIDRILFRGAVTDLVATLPGRPAPASAVCLLLIGISIICLDSESRNAQRALQITLLLVVAIALERCVGLVYREMGMFSPRPRLFGRPTPFPPMFPTTAVAFIWLAIGTLYARLHRREGWLGLFYTRGPHQLMTRRMVPVAILMPIVFGWLGMLTFRSGLRGIVMPFSLVVAAMIVLLLTVILLNARAMRVADAARVRTEIELADRERLQHAVLENAGAGILVLDVDGRALTTNRMLREMLGYTEAELAGPPFWIVTCADGTAENRRLFDELMQGQRDSYYLETACTRKDGSAFWAAISTSVVRNEKGRTELVIAMMQDVTERREGEDTRRRLNDIIEATPDFVGIADLQQKMVYLNKAGRNSSGVRSDEISELSIRDFHPPESARHVVDEGIPSAIRDGVWTSETQLKSRNGAITPVSQVILAHKNQNGELAYLSTVMRDITYRKRLELAQQFLLDVSRASSGSMDTDTILRSLVSLVVPRHADYCAIYMLSPRGTLEKTAFCRSQPDGTVAQQLRVYGTNKEPSPIVADVARTAEAVLIPRVTDADLCRLFHAPRHLPLLRKLGLRSMMVLPLRGRDRVLGVICYQRTQTDKPFRGHRVALAREMSERAALALDNADLLKRAREATRIRDEVLRVVAHDLRNPLNTVVLTADFVHERLGTLQPQPWMAKLDIIIKSAMQANRLIDDLLDVARMESGKLSIDPIPTSVQQLVDEIIQTHQPLAEARGVRLRADVPAKAGDVLADPSRVTQVFSNLIGNAIKFCPEGTEILLYATQYKDSVRFSIHDRGPGIAEQDRAHLFDPFWQASKGKDGVGLGLPIAKAIVQAHGGRMWLESQVGHGSTFFFTLPIARVESAGLSAAD